MAEEKTIPVKYRPGPGDPHHTTAFGQKFMAGETVNLHERHAEKVRGNPFFAVEGEETYGDGEVLPVALGNDEAGARAVDQTADLEDAQRSSDKDKETSRRRRRQADEDDE